jgi:hypothetical protein
MENNSDNNAKESAEHIQNALSLLEYHHRAMESRRAIELKIFTAAIAFFLVITKGLYDAREVLYSYQGAGYFLAVPFLLSLVIYLFMLLCIESASKRNRQKYHYWSDRIDALVKEELLDNSGNNILKRNGSPSAGNSDKKRDNVDFRNSKRSESFLQTLLSSWAAVPPFLAAVVIAFSCYMFLIVSFRSEVTKEDNKSHNILLQGTPRGCAPSGP